MPIPSAITALPRSLAREDVYRTIKDWIVHLQLAPGELIRDQELAERLGVSRTPVREALRRLEDEGLIVTSLHKWTKVAPSEIGEAEQLYPAVAALEATATEIELLHLSAADLKQLSAINKAMEQAVKQHDAEQAATLDMEFHALIVQHDQAGTSWEAGSETWRFPDAIAPWAGDLLSAKQSCDAFRDTGLQERLAERSIGRIFVCGYATEFCIDTSVRRAASLGLETVVITDAHTTRNRPHLKAPQIIEHHNWVWQEFSNPGNPIRLCTADAVEFDVS